MKIIMSLSLLLVSMAVAASAADETAPKTDAPKADAPMPKPAPAADETAPKTEAPMPKPAPPTPPQKPNLAAGAAVYKAQCLSCHGVNGSGNPAMAATLKVKPTALSLMGALRFNDMELSKIIAVGRGKMPAFPKEKLNNVEVIGVIAYVRSFTTKTPVKP